MRGSRGTLDDNYRHFFHGKGVPGLFDTKFWHVDYAYRGP
jgi:hypothetical protein